MWRRMEKISWREMKTNEEVLHVVGYRKKEVLLWFRSEEGRKAGLFMYSEVKTC